MSLDRNAIGSLNFQEYLTLIENRYQGKTNGNDALETHIENKRFQTDSTDV